MGKMALGYGSEWHMLRYLGRYRSVLDAQVREVTGASEVRWLDSNSLPTEDDTEWKGIGFLPEAVRNNIGAEWAAWWPQRGNPPNWDAVAELSGREWLLVEAKAHIGEVRSSCAAKDGEGRELIARTLTATQAALGTQGHDWMNGYYQAANRLAFLHFLQSRGISARLLFVYFVGDRREGSETTPQTEAEWMPTLQAQDAHLGLVVDRAFDGRVHKLFLPVRSIAG